MRRRVIKALSELDAVPVENPACPGTPDINYIGGWLELKYVKRWPSRGGNLRIKHFTPQQRIWLRRRCMKGGVVHLLLQVGRTWVLFGGEVASIAIGEGSKEELLNIAEHVWDGFPGDKLVDALRPNVLRTAFST